MEYQIFAGFTVMMLCGIILMILTIIAIIIFDGKHLETQLLNTLDRHIFVNHFWEKSFPFRLLLWVGLIALSYLFFGWIGLIVPFILFVARPIYAPKALRACLKRDAHQEWAINHKLQYDFLKSYPMIALHLATFNPDKISDQNELKMVKALEMVPKSEEKVFLKQLKAELTEQEIYPTK